MEGWKQYVISIIGCCLICGTVLQMLSESKGKSLLRLICGMILGITLLGPLSGIRPEDLQLFTWPCPSPEPYITDGERTAQQIRAEYIKAACEAYILDKAEILGAEIGIQITLNAEQIPISAKLSGEGSDDAQSRLQQILIRDLGIPKENQEWTWNQENNSSYLP